MLCRLNQAKSIPSAAIDQLLGIVRDSAFWGLCRSRHRPQSIWHCSPGRVRSRR